MRSCCDSRAFKYDVILAPSEAPITLAEVKSFLKLGSGAEDDTLLTMLIWSAYNIFLEFSDFILMKTKYRVYADKFCYKKYLYKVPFDSVSSYQYKKDDVFVDVDSSLYYIDTASYIASINLKSNKTYPSDIDDTTQSIKIEFFSGIYDTALSISSKYYDIKLGLLNLVSFLYENRGDCDLSFTTSAFSLLLFPATFKSIVSKYNTNLIRFF